MLYTIISSIVIIIILSILTRLENTRAKHSSEMIYLSPKHTELLKGVATLLILISHISNYKEFSVLIPLGGIGVSLFLISSGFGLNESFKKKGLKQFFRGRFLKIMIPYWIMVLFY